jgi:pyruvate dehydrogenase E1 component beta subunit
MVLRGPSGGYDQGAEQHSHSFESWFSFIPGLKVICPATPYDAKGLLISAIRDNNPVICFEQKKLYSTEGEVPEEDYVIPIGKADIKRKGSDITIVSYAFMTLKSLEAAKELEKDGIDAEIVDLRSTSPLDRETVLRSLEKTGKILIVQEAWPNCSVSSEVAAAVAMEGVEFLDSPVRRITAREAPIPFSPVLENHVLPQTEDIIQAVKEMVD